MNNSNNNNREGEEAEEATTITEVKTTADTPPPKLLTYCVKGSLECKLCHTRDDVTYYLYTRKQLHVCSNCDKSLEAIMGSNRGAGFVT